MLNVLKQLFLGGFEQTPDNNKSFENQLENEFITGKLNNNQFVVDFALELMQNEKRTLQKLSDYIQVQRERCDNLLITRQQARNEAIDLFHAYKSADFIDTMNVLRPDLEAEITKVIDRKV